MHILYITGNKVNSGKTFFFNIERMLGVGRRGNPHRGNTSNCLPRADFNSLFSSYICYISQIFLHFCMTDCIACFGTSSFENNTFSEAWSKKAVRIARVAREAALAERAGWQQAQHEPALCPGSRGQTAFWDALDTT